MRNPWANPFTWFLWSVTHFQVESGDAMWAGDHQPCDGTPALD